MYTIVETPVFQRYAKEIWSDDELTEFKVWLANNALSGDVISGTDGMHKVRWICQPKFYCSWKWSLRMTKKSTDTELVMDAKTQQFHDDLLQSVREFKAGNYARVTQIEPTLAARVRQSVGVTQTKFASLLGVSVRTLQEWEQGRREPTGAAKTLLSIALKTPEALRAVV